MRAGASFLFIFVTLFARNCPDQFQAAHATQSTSSQRPVGGVATGHWPADLSQAGHSPERRQTDDELEKRLAHGPDWPRPDPSTDYTAKFSAYTIVFKKHYASLREKMFRFWVFLATYFRVSASKLAYASQKRPYFLELNKFSDMKRDERRKVAGLNRSEQHFDELELAQVDELGHRRSRRQKRHLTMWQFYPSPRLEAFQRPDQLKREAPVDWRHSPDRCLEEQVADQGDCNSCYAVASMRLFEWLHCRHQQQQQTGAKMTPVRFSEQYLIDCGRPFGLAGCQSGSSRGLLEFVRRAGLLEASRKPYLAREDQCGGSSSDWLEVELPDRKRALRHAAALVPKNVAPKFVPSANWLDELRNGPLLVWIDLSDSFYDYGGGLYEPEGECDRQLGHFMLLVGFGHDARNQRPFWLLANSFGPDFGESGYVRVPAHSANAAKRSDYETNCLLYAMKVNVQF